MESYINYVNKYFSDNENVRNLSMFVLNTTFKHTHHNTLENIFEESNADYKNDPILTFHYQLRKVMDENMSFYDIRRYNKMLDRLKKIKVHNTDISAREYITKELFYIIYTYIHEIPFFKFYVIEPHDMHHFRVDRYSDSDALVYYVNSNDSKFFHLTLSPIYKYDSSSESGYYLARLLRKNNIYQNHYDRLLECVNTLQSNYLKLINEHEQTNDDIYLTYVSNNLCMQTECIRLLKTYFPRVQTPY